MVGLLLNTAAVQIWKDYKLIWNESDYGNLKDIRIAAHDIWTPDILLYNRCVNERMLIDSVVVLEDLRSEDKDKDL